MVFSGVVDSVTRSRAYYLMRVKRLPIHTVAEIYQTTTETKPSLKK